MDECIFCNLAQKKGLEKKFYDSKNFFVVEDIKPVNKGHCLIISKKHFENIFYLPSNLGTELMEIIKSQSNRLIDGKKADGIRIIVNNNHSAGQVVFHFHLHIIPYKNKINF